MKHTIVHFSELQRKRLLSVTKKSVILTVKKKKKKTETDISDRNRIMISVLWHQPKKLLHISEE